MAYNDKKDTYTCDTCGFENKWNANDDVHGELWGCEKCGNMFCSKCFIEKHGRTSYMSMMQGSDYLLCPDCYGKKNTENKEG